MGKGYTYKCPNCNHEEEILIGVGLFFFKTRQKVTDQAAKGKYGVSLKRLVNSGRDIVVSPAKYIYYCDDCHTYKNDYLLDAFEQLDNGKSELIFHYIHKCPICHKEMKQTEEKPFFPFKCPKCKTEMNYAGEFLWD